MFEVIAPDGKPYDIAHLKYLPTKDDVEVIQYLRPNGVRRRMFAPVGIEYVKKAKDMVLSAEDLKNGEVAIYGRMKDQSEDDEIVRIAINGSGYLSPTNVLRKLILEVLERG